MTRNKIGAFALVIGSLIIFALPAGSFGSTSAELKAAREALVKAGQQLQAGLESTVQKTGEATAGLVNKTKAGLQKATTSKSRATATDPPTQPPTHGTNPHGEGTIAIVDIDPSSERPLAADPDGGDSGEDVVVGRSRGERNADGSYHGHISAVGLFGNDVIPVDTVKGETKDGPLQSLQANILDPLCTNTNQQVCLTVLRMHSETTGTGTSNDFAVARASLLGLGVGAADSQGVAGQAGACQASAAGANTANVATSTGTVAQVAKSTSTSTSCKGAAPVVTNTSQVIGLGGTGVPLPAAGCANGTPDTQAGLPGLLPIICNAEEMVGNNAAVREALDVFALQIGTNSLLKETTAASESLSVAPEGGTQCSNGIDDDGDGKIDDQDEGCHTDGNPANPNSYDPTDDSEATASGAGGSGDTGNNNADDGGGDDDGSGDAQCADGRDNDGDGVTDEDDPGCHEGNNINNPYNPDDDSEGSDGGGGGGDGAGSGNLDSGELPFTGTDVIGISLAGLLVLAGGLLLRRREDVRTVR
jgi:LPXTG-motif cell wall-anchored protein